MNAIAGVVRHGEKCEAEECGESYPMDLTCADSVWEGTRMCLAPCTDLPAGVICSDASGPHVDGSACSVECDSSDSLVLERVAAVEWSGQHCRFAC